MSNLRILMVNAVIAAIYAILTIVLAPVSYGPVQIRFSEFMTLFAFSDRKWIPGLVAGCFLANMGSPFGLPDMLVGTTATFLATVVMSRCAHLFVASLAPVFFNGVLIALELAYLTEIPEEISLWAMMAYIGAGEFLSVSVSGILIYKGLLKNKGFARYFQKA
ncbi:MULTISPECIES: QueT transporter family protein [Megasphaera]|uniref:QueT transporter n=1 Tax=Megasphaera vaginalis (ex Srinivasan et al. 2021) TaxID=1111454 RepID=U7UUY7_9FIRM|nr:MULTISPECIES: QueT transporter family protein [Megasphaera]ERT62278.1 QueT transporter [Megasphaera vaginalis (ex Srinivasan et al. 2021)]